jgi:hypothetical protein
MPLGLHTEVSQDGVNIVGLWQRSPVDLLRGHLVELGLEAMPDPLIPLDHELKGLIHGLSPVAAWLYCEVARWLRHQAVQWWMTTDRFM